MKMKNRTRGKGLKKEIWFSFCSRHYTYNADCDICNNGWWVNSIKDYLSSTVSSVVYFISKRFWIWWVNRDIKKY